ncbi:MAG TPA: FAD-dependent monooxygenase [Chloroflexia bacterium]|nr:FAD-dependent monooxygenase [Chloroflexia bacterium]
MSSNGNLDKTDPVVTGRQREAIVVGAGPVGLVAALALHAGGRSVTVLEGEPEGRQRPGSRAIYIHKATLKFLEQICAGLGRELADHGLVWPTKRTFYRGQEVYVRQYPPFNPADLPPFTSLPQVEIERLLMAACQKAGIELAWNERIKDVTTSEGGVTLTTEAGRTWEARYVIAADGARSAIRRSLDIPMEGERSKNYFIVVDVKEDPEQPLPLERVFHYEHPAVGHRNVLLVPFQGGWRIDLQCNEADNAQEFSSEEGVRRWLSKVVPARYAGRITWVSTYQFLQQIAGSFTDQNRRVLLVGEAAHLFAPFGARGLNSGVADAVMAAEAVAGALRADSPGKAREAIENFASERRAAADYNRNAAGVALKHMTTGGSRWLWLKRYAAARVAALGLRAGRWLDEGPYGPRTGPGGKVSSKY